MLAHYVPTYFFSHAYLLCEKVNILPNVQADQKVRGGPRFRNVLTDARHLVPGDVHGQVSHLGSNSRQADEALHTVGDVSSKLTLQHGRGQLQVLHFCLGRKKN